MQEKADIEHMSETNWRRETHWRGWNQWLMKKTADIEDKWDKMNNLNWLKWMKTVSDEKSADTEQMNEKKNEEFKPAEEHDINN